MAGPVRHIMLLLVSPALLGIQTLCGADPIPSPAETAGAPAPQAKVVKDPVISPFGIGSGALRGRDPERWLPQMVEIGVQDLRVLANGWSAWPKEDVWTWTDIDRRLDYLDSIGVQGGIIFNGKGPWNTKDQQGRFPLNSLPEWSRMVHEVVKHTKGRVKLFECWNEPPNFAANAPASDYAKVVVATYDAAKAANPEAMVGMSAKSAHISYLDQAIRAGAKGHFDYITLHPYELLGAVVSHPGYEPAYMSIAPTVRKMLQAQDPAKVNCPIIFSELGADATRGIRGFSGADAQAQALIKAYSMGIAQGIACIHWFEGMDGDSGPMGLMDKNGNKRPAYYAFARLIEHLGRHPAYLGWILLNNQHYGFVFRGARGPVLVTWTSTWKTDEIDFGQQVRIIDPLTGSASQASKYALSVAPILVFDFPEQLVEEAKANTKKPFLWGGDYSKAKAVSVAFGEKYEEKGLHTRAADGIAADVLAYGGNARAGELPQHGNAFYVDPNFLSYDTVPIQIEVVVKRDTKDSPFSVTMEYETTTGNGYRKAEPFPVPAGDQWHTATWKIEDSQFVGTWGYHFRLNTGKCRVQSVTVTRLDR